MAIGFDVMLEGWVIADGNYPHFSRGDEVEFALEFGADATRVDECVSPSARRVDEFNYEVAAVLTAAFDDALVVDCGVQAYQQFRRDRPVPTAEVGDSLRGTMSFAVDPFFYFESLASRPGMPPLVYSWKVNRIRAQTHPPVMRGVPDATYRDVDGTDEGGGFMLLTCELLDVPPKHERHRAR